MARDRLIGSENSEAPPFLSDPSQPGIKVPQVSPLSDTNSIGRVGQHPAFSGFDVFESVERCGERLIGKLDVAGNAGTFCIVSRRRDRPAVAIRAADQAVVRPYLVLRSHHELFPQTGVETRPLHELEFAADSRRYAACDHRGFNGDRTRSTHWIDERGARSPATRENHRRRQSLTQWRFGNLLPIATSMQQRAGAICADLALVINNTHDETLQRRLCLVRALLSVICVFGARLAKLDVAAHL